MKPSSPDLTNWRQCLIVIVVFALAACGGEPQPRAGESASTPLVSSATPATTPPATSGALAPITGTIHEIKMLGDAKGYRFEPTAITIKPGDAVRWTMVSGGPHNVTFWPDSIPSGAAPQLTAAMPKQTAPLTGPLLMQPNEAYTVSFGGATPGRYRYYCTPHLALGMKATITVQ